MADVQHATLPDNQLHYPRGAAGAATGTVCTSNGDGTTSFSAIPAQPPRTTDLFTTSSTVAQEATSAGDEVQITFGAPATSPNGSISVAADGNVTVNQTGLYDILWRKNVGRSTNAGINSVAFSTRINGAQVVDTAIVSLDNTDAGFTVGNSVNGLAYLTAGDVLSFHMLYQSGGSGNVGVYPVTIATSGWGNVPSASLNISKIDV